MGGWSEGAARVAQQRKIDFGYDPSMEENKNEEKRQLPFVVALLMIGGVFFVATKLIKAIG